MRYFQNKKFIFSLNDANNRRNKTDNAGWYFKIVTLKVKFYLSVHDNL